MHQKGSSVLVSSHRLKSMNKMNLNPIGYLAKFLYGRVEILSVDLFCIWLFSWCRVRSTLVGIRLKICNMMWETDQISMKIKEEGKIINLV